MKKFLIIFLSLVLMIVCVGCGSYNPPIYVENPNGGSTGGSGGSGGGDTDTPPDDDKDIPDKPNTPAEEVFTFTVTLYETDGRGRESRFYPSAEQNVQVQWMGDGSAATAWFDLTGVATYTGLDGDYRVTLSKLPTDSLGNQTHTYNPNGITASNNNRDIKIVLIPIRTHVSGTGTSSSNPFFIQSEGAYQVVLNTGSGASSQRWFRYIPQEPGIYTIETLVDADANEINPTIRYYMSNNGGWVSSTPETYPDGGYTNGGFTKNAKYEVYISGGDAAINEVGNPRLFTIAAESSIGYPVRIYFSITYMGEYYSLAPVRGYGPYYTGPAPQGSFRLSYLDNPNGPNRYATDGSGVGNDMRFKLQWEDLDSNGKYTPAEWTDTTGNGVYDPGDEWKDNNGNGIFDEGDEWRDTNGNGEFDQGDAWWDLDGDGECGLDTGDGFYHFYTKDENGEDVWGDMLWVTLSGDYDDIAPAHGYMGGRNPVSRTKDYRQLVEIDYAPYYSRYGGRHPVNKELMEMFQDIALGLGYFNDGTGVAETGIYFGEAEQGNSGVRVDSGHDTMFLIFCGYYV